MKLFALFKDGIELTLVSSGGGASEVTLDVKPSHMNAVGVLHGGAVFTLVVQNTGWLPAQILTDDGFVRVDPDLSVPGYPGVFAIGDVADTDPLRTSARNRADKLLARNVRAHLAGRPLRSYRPPHTRWGSVIGAQRDGLTVFTASGRSLRFPAWSIRVVLMDWITRRGIYKGVRS